MENHYVISIDLGTTNAKAAIVAHDGSLLSTATGSIPLIHVGDDGIEQDPEIVWTVIKGIIQQLVGESEIPSSRIMGIITAANYASVVPVDQDGLPTMNFIVHLDQRSSTAKLKQYPGFKPDNSWQQLKWMRRAGLPPLSSGVDTLSRMRLVKYAFPEVYSRTRTFLEPVDFVTMRLSGRHTASQCTALTMLGTDNNRHHRTQYDSELIRMSQIDPGKWPELVPDNAVVGLVRPELADELGLAPTTKVFSGVNDTQASGIGAAAFAGTHAAIGIGTTGVITTHADRRKTDLLRGMVSMPVPVADKFLVLGEAGLGGKVIEYFLTHLVYPNDGFADHSADATFAALDQVLASVPPGSNGLLFLPWLSGMLAPKSEPAMRGCVMNLNLGSTRAELARSAVEGLVFHLNWVLEQVEAFTKRRISHLVAYGGGTRSREAIQILADVAQIPVHRTADPEFVSVVGAAYLAFVQQGLIDIGDISSNLKISEVVQPRRETQALYATQYGDFQYAFKKTLPLFKRINLR